ncbi:DUF6702 family protein [Microbulbifer thermotolerans]|uniref:Uncharacterized protein n=1 Tax=Microbulbifer thermotolerans TaxID=252514 RepID=A0A143HLJ3_MICTH|nr:DUF6702 family protein [Microbulbifer thermotolerans]AMX02558.1 hypothetical protein A3224_08145 [Microbulbifer thermotolerans]
MKIPFSSFIFLVITMAFSLNAQAHRYHFGLTELSVNERTQMLEVSHRFFVADMQRALSLKANKDLKDAQAQIEEYVNSRFQMRDKKGTVLKPTWVGMEADVHNIWIYQEIPLADIQGNQLTVRQSMLMDIERDQVNTLNVTSGGKTTSHTLMPGASQKVVHLQVH